VHQGESKGVRVLAGNNVSIIRRGSDVIAEHRGKWMEADTMAKRAREVEWKDVQLISLLCNRFKRRLQRGQLVHCFMVQIIIFLS